MRFFSRYILWFVTSLLASCQQLPQTSVPSPTVVLPAPAPTVIPTFPSIEPLISVTPTPPVFSRLLPITADNAADLKLFSSLTQDSIHSLTWSPDGKFIVASTSHGLKLYSSLSLKEKPIRLSPSLAESFAATFSPAGTMMAWIETDNSSESGLWLWDLIKNAKSFIPIHDLQDITFSPNGSLLAGAIYEGGVQVWDTKSGKMIVSFTSAGGATDVNFGPDAY